MYIGGVYGRGVYMGGGGIWDYLAIACGYITFLRGKNMLYKPHTTFIENRLHIIYMNDLLCCQCYISHGYVSKSFIVVLSLKHLATLDVVRLLHSDRHTLIDSHIICTHTYVHIHLHTHIYTYTY